MEFKAPDSDGSIGNKNYTNTNTNKMTITAELSCIIYLPLAVLEQIFSKVEKYVYYSTDSIKTSPGETESPSSFIVASASNPSSPHTVIYHKNGKYDSDGQCLRFKSYKICSHTVALVEYNEEMHKFVEYFKKYSKNRINDLTDVNLSSKVGQKKTKLTQKRKGQTQFMASKTCSTMYATNQKANHSVENSSTVSSIYGNIQDFDSNRTLEEVSQELAPVSLNANFQRPPYPDPIDPIPATFATAIISYCPPNTSTCFGCRKNLREFGDLCFITKSRRPIGRDENGVITYTQEQKNGSFHQSENCVRQLFPNFLACDAPLYVPHCNLLSQEQIDILAGLAIAY